MVMDCTISSITFTPDQLPVEVHVTLRLEPVVLSAHCVVTVTDLLWEASVYRTRPTLCAGRKEKTLSLAFIKCVWRKIYTSKQCQFQVCSHHPIQSNLFITPTWTGVQQLKIISRLAQPPKSLVVIPAIASLRNMQEAPSPINTHLGANSVRFTIFPGRFRY